MRKRKSDERGFTLIEVIVTLVLVGITAALAGLWIVNVANGYIFAKMNADTVQKAQLAMTRLTKEFAAMQSVSAASDLAITYRRMKSDLSVTDDITVQYQNGEIQINGDTLTDRVSAFTLQYCNDKDTDGTQVCGTTWPTTGTRRIIEITLTLRGADNTPSTFTRRVAPRNL